MFRSTSDYVNLSSVRETVCQTVYTMVGISLTSVPIFDHCEQLCKSLSKMHQWNSNLIGHVFNH